MPRTKRSFSKRFGRNNGRRSGQHGGYSAGDGRTPYKEPVKENQHLEKYYKELGIIAEEDWPMFMEWLRKPLHITFRVNLVCPFRDQIRAALTKDLQLQVPVDGEVLPPPAPVKWFPGDAVWQIEITPRGLKKTPHLKKLHRWLVQQQSVGNISRQELVSMVPPLFLNPQPTDRVFDMCASPGSKTMQILEMMHSGAVGSEGSLEKGLVVANDLDNRRAHLLVHQVKRLGSKNLVVTNHPAQLFPIIGGRKKTKAARAEYFDRVLCDVPCSGDGTIRKQPDVWRKWSQNNGSALHPLQVKITLRGVDLLKDGGTLVYSTCSMNPSENEAVVAEVLRQRKGSVELVDTTGMFPDLRRAPGVSAWKVAARSTEIVWLKSIENVSPKHKDKYTRSLWPPTVEEAEDMHLNRCMRFYPHFQDTGGFFVCILRKKVGHNVPENTVNKAHSAINSMKCTGGDSSTASSNSIDRSNSDVMPEEKRMKCESESTKSQSSEIAAKKNRKHEEFIFKPLPRARYMELRDYFGLKQTFASDGGNLFLRSNSDKVVNYFSNSIMDAFCTGNEMSARVGNTLGHVKMVSAGVKVFEVTKKNRAGPFRLRQEGVHLVLEHMSKRKVAVTLAELHHILQERPKNKEGKQSSFDYGKLRVETRQIVENMNPGSFVFVVDDPAYPISLLRSEFGGSIAMVAWKNPSSFHMMVAKEELLSKRTFVSSMIDGTVSQVFGIGGANK